nr:PREDICTED: uncharacterized protein LOC105673139 [Linepithema humile]
MVTATRDPRDRPTEIEVGKPSHTEQLTKWITDVRYKKLKCYRSPKRDFRVEAVLTRTLHKAEYELRVKQLSRMHRWRRLRKQLLKGVEYGSCGLYNAAEREFIKCKKNSSTKENNPWGGNLCEDLSSLDEFLHQLGTVKSVVRR